jgi:hypothetical protein
MASNSGPAAFQAGRQALINLALKRDPIPLRPKPIVSFFDESSPTGTTVNELPQGDPQISVISPPQMFVNQLPPASSMIKSTRTRSISTLSPML